MLLQRSEEDSSSCKSPDSSRYVISSISQSQFWGHIATTLENLIAQDIPCQEYDMLEDEFRAPLEPCGIGKQLDNARKNRYMNIVPCNGMEDDSNRVLVGEGDVADYINASYLGPAHEYIATQAPIPETFNDFWKMIFTERIDVIVMLTREREGSRIKAHPYWPYEGESDYGDITVALLVEDTLENFIVREFLLTSNNGEELRVTQYQYTSWPDHSVPQESSSIIEIMSFINQRTTEMESNSPILVHCSAGIGRTGAFILLHAKLLSLKQAYHNVDEFGHCEIPPISLMDSLRELRKQRHGMVTRKTQYLFAYETLLKEIQKLANQESATA